MLGVKESVLSMGGNYENKYNKFEMITGRLEI
jgi:hypothetical protein